MNRKSPDDGEPMKREPKDMSPVRRMTDEKPANRSADKLGDKLAGAKAKAIVTAVCILLALVSAFPLANHFSSPDTYAGLIASLDEKAGNVAALTATSTAASVVVTMIPGDVGTPVAEKLVDISADFGIVLDPYCGTGTTCKVACDLHRRAIGIDIDGTYIKLARERTQQQSLSMF